MPEAVQLSKAPFGLIRLADVPCLGYPYCRFGILCYTLNQSLSNEDLATHPVGTGDYNAATGSCA